MGETYSDEPPDRVKPAPASSTPSDATRDHHLEGDYDNRKSHKHKNKSIFHRRNKRHGRDHDAGERSNSWATTPDARIATKSAQDTQVASEKPAAVEYPAGGDGSPTPSPPQQQQEQIKRSYVQRAKAGSVRFVYHAKDAIFYSYVNVLLVFVPIGIAVNFANLPPAVVFAMNAVAIVPLAGLLSAATESVADRLGDTLGALLNVSFGNAVELIIFIIALAKNEIRIVQASILGSILANLLLILGMAFFLGGLRYQEQVYNSTVTQMSACLLSLSVMSLLLPTAFHASWADDDSATSATLKVSRGTSVILLVIYVLYLLFQLKSHSYLYESMPQHIIDEESHPGILHDVLNSSTSSSSSDTSSDSDSDSSSASAGTAKRAFRRFRRKHRKSSASSTHTPPHLSSNVSSASYEAEKHGPASPGRAPMLNTVFSGDEADDADGENGHSNIRDFEHHTGQIAPPRERKSKRRHKKSRKHRKSRPVSRGQSEAGAVAPAPIASHAHGPLTASPEPEERKVEFAESSIEEQQAAEEQRRLEASRNRIRNPFNIPTRPAIQKTLSSAIPTVFQTAPAGQPANAPPMPAQRTTSSIRVAMGPRRVRSLPDRMSSYPPLTASQSASRATPPVLIAPTGADLTEHNKDDGAPKMSRTAAVVLLVISTALVALCAEFMVDAIPAMTKSSAVSQTFIGLIILPIVGNAAEHVTAVTVAAKNKMDLAIGVAVGSSIQIALFVTPLVVLLGWILKKEMSLYFNLFETVSLFVTAFVVNFLVLDGRSNYLEGALLMGAYVIIAVAAFFYPDGNDQSALGGNGTEDVARRMVGLVVGGALA